MDQATATVIGAVLTFSGAIVGALISTLWKREPKHQIIEYRLRHDLPGEVTPWLQSDNAIARVVRGIGWVVVFLTSLFGVQLLCLVPFFWVINPDFPHRNYFTAAAIPWAILSLVISRWITRRIKASENDNSVDVDEEDD